MRGSASARFYRRFPSRDDLVDALYVEAMERLVAIGEAAVERSETDPWGAIEDFLTNYLQMHAEDRSSRASSSPMRMGGADSTPASRRWLRWARSSPRGPRRPASFATTSRRPTCR